MERCNGGDLKKDMASKKMLGMLKYLDKSNKCWIRCGPVEFHQFD
jgi:hypothetical protein